MAQSAIKYEFTTESDRDLYWAWQQIESDPEGFLRNILGDDPWQKQVDIINSVRENTSTVVKSCHGPGKSWLAARVALWFLFAYPHSLVITTAPTNRQVKNILWRELRVAHKNAKFPLGGKLLQQELELDDDWVAIGFTAADYDPDRFQGFHAVSVLAVIDEACGMTAPIQEAIEGILSGAHCRKLQIGNPTDPNTIFAEDFKDPTISKITITAFESPNFTKFGITEEDIADGSWEKKITGPLPYPALVSPQWVADRYRRWGPSNPMYQSRVLAKFPKESRDALISLALVEAAQNRTLEPLGDIELGVDIAEMGGDETTIYKRQGPVVRLVDAYTKEETMVTVGQIVKADREVGGAAVIKVDKIGIGSGVVSRLNELVDDSSSAFNTTVIGVNVGETGGVDTEEFTNLKAQLFWGLRQRFEDGDIDIDPDDEELAAQLVSIKVVHTSRGQTGILSKKNIKASDRPSSMASKSPDRAEGVMLAFADVGSGEAVFHVS